MTNTKTHPAKSQNKPSGNVLLKASNVSKEYRDGDRILKVLKDVSLTVHYGEFISIIGQSGSGKSTLLHLLGALDHATHGSVTLDGVDYSTLSNRQMAKVRQQRIGFIYQFHHLLPEFTAVENVYMPGMISGTPIYQMIDRAEMLLKRVGLGERFTHRPVKLSGGEQQRVALSRALMNDPDIILADEPTGDLDQTTGVEIMDFVIRETREMGKSLIVVTHDPALADRADRTFILENGQLRQRDN